METFEIILILASAVLVSAVFDQLLPRVSIPLVQIGIGLVMGLFIATPTEVFSNPEFFLVLFVAPLLFDETRHASKTALIKNMYSILSLAIGLVVATCLAVGFALHLIVPSISLAAAFALGAALGPTDAVAVMSLGKDVKLTERQKSVLSGEALINDASGVVTFQFAIAAATTGAFSLADALGSFFVDFFGGIAVGLVLAGLVMGCSKLIRDRGLETGTLHMLVQVLLPFVSFLAAETIGVSGILSVVATGIAFNAIPRKMTPEESRMKITSSSVWEILIFLINGVVFVLLGMKLTNILLPTWNQGGMTDPWLIPLLVLLVTVLVVGVRYLWILGMDHFWLTRPDPQDPALPQPGEASCPAGSQPAAADAAAPAPDAATAHTKPPIFSSVTAATAINSLVTTLSGPKGAVSLAVILSLPYYLGGVPFANRDLLILIASGVIVVTLLLANFVVPLLTPSADEGGDLERAAVEREILQNVVAELLSRQTPENASATTSVVSAYTERMLSVGGVSVSQARIKGIRVEILKSQERFVRVRGPELGVDADFVNKYADRLESMAYSVRGLGLMGAILSDRTKASPSASAVSPIGQIAGWFKRSFNVGEKTPMQEIARMELMIETEQCALGYLSTIAPTLDEEGAHAAAILESEYRSLLTDLETRRANYRDEQAAIAAQAAAAASQTGSDQGFHAGQMAAANANHGDLASNDIQLQMAIDSYVTPDSVIDHDEILGESLPTLADVAEASELPTSSEPGEASGSVRDAMIKKISASRKLEDETRNAALRIELDQIQAMRAAGRLTAGQARELREEVYLLRMSLGL